LRSRRNESILNIHLTFFQSQALPFHEIVKMKETKNDSKEIIETIVANSRTFNQKTEFSQEKYLKKKEKKYCEYIQIRKPTIRLLAHIYYRQDYEKILGMRMDSLSQIISYAGVNASGKYLLYDAGSCGLASAAFLNSMGPLGDSKLIVMHPGNFTQKQAVFALNLDEKHLSKCISVNIYSVLRQFYQGKAEESDHDEEPSESKKIKLDSEIETNGNHKKSKNARRQKWIDENEEAIEILRQKVDGLTVVSKEDPFPIIKELLPFVHAGRPIVIFHHCKELLMECFQSMKQLNCAVNLRLFSTFMRNIQVLPRRTHPHVQV
jgi:tRNA (adenine58-N1)-methyltransferase non-catalytic subunit